MKLSQQSDDLIGRLEASTAAEIDLLDFGVIGFDADEQVAIYNAHEAALSGLSPSRVIGSKLFSEVAPCTNNFLVAERYRNETALDETLDYVFTLRMKPTPVHLRLLAHPEAQHRYLVVSRRPAE